MSSTSQIKSEIKNLRSQMTIIFHQMMIIPNNKFDTFKNDLRLQYLDLSSKCASLQIQLDHIS